MAGLPRLSRTTGEDPHRLGRGREPQRLRTRSWPSRTTRLRTSVCPAQSHDRLVLRWLLERADRGRHSEYGYAHPEEARIRRGGRSLLDGQAVAHARGKREAAIPDLALDEARARAKDARGSPGTGTRRRRCAPRPRESSADRSGTAALSGSAQRHISERASANASRPARHFQKRSGARS